jgi:predicted DNA binding protein
MSVISDISVDAGDFKLGRTLSDHRDVTIHLERIVPLGERLIPYLWVAGEERVVEAVLTTLRTELAVRDVERVGIEGDRTLVRIEWAEDADSLLETIVATGGTVLEGVGAADRWYLTLRFDDQEALSAFYEACAGTGIAVTVDRVHDPAADRSPDWSPRLTDAQREVLRAAYEDGYFEVPRQTTTNELAERFDVSDTAISQRLRRALQRLVGETVFDRDPDEP